MGTGLKVCLVESGGWRDEPETQALYEGQSIGHQMTLNQGRYRIFGGTATRWGGRSALLDQIDFERREWVRNSGWPITLTDLIPYYDRAKAISNFKQPWSANGEVERCLGIQLPDLASETISHFIWRVASPDLVPTLWNRLQPGWCRTFDYGRAYRPKLARDPDTCVFLHANLTSMQATVDGTSIASATVSTLSRKTMTIKARAFVLCCGGIENVRHLLHLPAETLRKANSFDNIGRFMAQHLRGLIGIIEATEATAYKLQRLYNNFHRPRGSRARQPQYEVGFALTERAQRAYKLLNASAAVYYDVGEDTSWKAARRLREAWNSRSTDCTPLRDIGKVFAGTAEVVPNAVRRYLMGREVVHKNPTISIVADFEQEPDPENRLTLSSDVDALGMRRIVADWSISEMERRTARDLCRFIASALGKLDLGQVRGVDWLDNDAPIGLGETYHVIGATRMSETPASGVVDLDCRVHGIENLYVAGCSVFPTGGHANPTLTIIALAVRLADHLRSEWTVHASRLRRLDLAGETHP